MTRVQLLNLIAQKSNLGNVGVAMVTAAKR